jgi:tetratricopeptide (TPR) repeat protein
LRTGQFNLAIADSSKALELHPRYIAARADRAMAYYYKGEYNKAWEDVRIGQRMGIRFPPDFLEALRQASGREK